LPARLFAARGEAACRGVAANRSGEGDCFFAVLAMAPVVRFWLLLNTFV
jgi:hypothetical protein